MASRTNVAALDTAMQEGIGRITLMKDKTE